MNHSYSLGTWRLRTVVCVALLMVATGLLMGTPGLGRSIAPSAGAATTYASAANGHCPSGSAPGITSGQVKVTASVIDISSGSLSNATVGVPSTKQQEADYNLVANKINSEGGAGCRKIVMSFVQCEPCRRCERTTGVPEHCRRAALHRARQWSTHRGRRLQLYSAAPCSACLLVLDSR